MVDVVVSDIVHVGGSLTVNCPLSTVHCVVNCTSYALGSPTMCFRISTAWSTVGVPPEMSTSLGKPTINFRISTAWSMEGSGGSVNAAVLAGINENTIDIAIKADIIRFMS
jgi:hypothetical protein